MIALWSLIALVSCIILHVIARRDFPRLKLLDSPKRYGLQRPPLPYPTGIIPVLIFSGIFAIVAPWTEQTAGILLAILLLALLSFVDDRSSLPAWLRLGTQSSIALLVFATGTRIYTLTNPFVENGLLKLDTIDIVTSLFGPLPLWSGVFTLFWLVVTTNALNWLDGIPGQVSILSCIGFAVIGALSLSDRVNQPELALLAFVLSALALGCACFDMPPNKVVMGDTGAMFFGFMLGVLTIYTGGKVATAFLVLGVPLIDFGLVIIRRIVKGKNPLQGSAHGEHLHHRLLAAGWSERQVIAVTAGLGTAFGVTALFLSSLGKVVAAAALFCIMIVLHLSTNDR